MATQTDRRSKRAEQIREDLKKNWRDSNREIARRLGSTQRTIRNHRQELESAGEILPRHETKAKRNGKTAKAGDTAPSVRRAVTSSGVQNTVQTAAIGKTVRETFTTSRSVDYLNETELKKQSGQNREDWILAMLKELVDNSVDNAEEIGKQPDVTITVAEDGITVTDKGSGIEPATVKGIVDLDSRTSNRSLYQTTTRGSQGNAWPTILGFAYNWDGEQGHITIEAQGVRHEITASMDRLVEKPIIGHRQTPLEEVQIGTSVKVHVHDLPSILDESEKDRIVLFGLRYAALNPHLRLTLDVFGERHEWEPTSDTCRKWTAAQPDPPVWYDEEAFEKRVKSTIAKDQDNDTDRPLRDFLRTFAGLKRSDALKAVSDETGLSRCGLSALLNCGGLDRDKTKTLLKAMQKHGTNPKPEKLGTIGREHITRVFGEVKYKKIVGHESGLPFVIEAAFAEVSEAKGPLIVTGCNFSPAITEPIVHMFNSLLQKRMVESDSGVTVLLHITKPAPNFPDWGKGVLSVRQYGSLYNAITDAITAVTKEWYTFQKRAERDAEASQKRAEKRAAMMRPTRMSLKDAVFRVLLEAIKQANGGIGIEFTNRDALYAARKLVQQYTDSELKHGNFDNIVDQWEEKHGLIEGRLRDARGFLLEPHSKIKIPLGTKAVDDYVVPLHLYTTILFFEKKGVEPKLAWARIPERYDVAVMASEGYAVRAAKTLLQAAQMGCKIRVLCFHDADPAGYNIARTLGASSGAHQFNIEIIDCGLTIPEALEMGLESETFTRAKRLPKNLVLNDLELEYFTGEPTKVWKNGEDRTRWVSCRRVELNALSADPHRFIAWVESKLEEHGVQKIVPPEHEILRSAREQTASLLGSLIREEFDRLLDLDVRVEKIAARLSRQVDLTDLPGILKEWAPKFAAESWKHRIGHTVMDRIREFDDSIVEAVEESLGSI